MEDGKVALVTGGSRGIGRAIVEALCAARFRVAFSYRERGDDAAALIDQVRAQGQDAQAFRADVGDATQARALAQSVAQAYGRVDVLVNNAGVHLPGARLGDMPAEEWDRILRVNLTGPFHLVQAVLPGMRTRKQGHIVNLSSNVTQRMPAGYGAYTVSKTALETFTRILSKEEGQYGIRVNAVAPGPIRTDMLREALEAMGPERADAFVKSVPLGRAGEPGEIAAAVAFLVSDAASYITGQVLYVNGGGPGG